MADDAREPPPPPSKSSRERDAGIEPLFFTSTSQELFKIVTGKDVTVEQPHRYVPKQDIVNDIQWRGVISDFHPVKDKIKEYPGDELLIVYDFGGLYDQNFYLCVTEEAKDAELRRWEDSKKKTEEVPVKKVEEKKRTTGWKSLGSEDDILEEKVIPTRDRITVHVCKKRREFLGQYKFSDKDAKEANDMYEEFRPFKDPNFELRRMELDVGTQVHEQLVDHAVQTTWNRNVNKTMQYACVDLSKDQKKKIQESDPVAEFLRHVAPSTEEALQQNETMNIYEDEFLELAEEDTTLGNKAESSIKEYQSFTDLQYSKNKKLACIDWMPNSKGVVAVSCAERCSFDERVDKSAKVTTCAILIWNFVDPIHPQFVLECPSDALLFRFNPKQPELVAAACYTGQVVLWDISSAQAQLKSKEQQKKEDEGMREAQVPVVKPLIVSSIETSHRMPVTDLRWLPSSFEVNHKGRIGDSQDSTQVHQLVTVGPDGQMLFWDCRSAKKEIITKPADPVWNPIFEVTMHQIGTSQVYGACQVLLNTADVGKDTKKEDLVFFYVTTEHGELVLGDLTRPEDVSHPEYMKSATCNHHGPIVSAQRSPFFPDIILTAGDWSFNIWKDGVKQAIFTSPCSTSYVTSARWSPTRPAVIVVAKADGVVDVWDLLDRSHEASMPCSCASSAITSLEFWNTPPQGNVSRQLLAVGDDNGGLHIMEIPRSLRRPVPNEKSIMQGYFSREVKRVFYVQERNDIRARDKPYQPPSDDNKGQGDAAQAKHEDPQVSTQTVAEKEEERMEREYKRYEEKVRKDLGMGADAEGQGQDQRNAG